MPICRYRHLPPDGIALSTKPQGYRAGSRRRNGAGSERQCSPPEAFCRIEKARDAKSIGIFDPYKTGQHQMASGPETHGLSPDTVIIPCRKSRRTVLDLGFGCYVNTACPRLTYDDQVPVTGPGPLPAGV